nr:hypothetical protein BAR15_120400 [Bartonella sp. AR 15-3]
MQVYYTLFEKENQKFQSLNTFPWKLNFHLSKKSLEQWITHFIFLISFSFQSISS